MSRLFFILMLFGFLLLPASVPAVAETMGAAVGDGLDAANVGMGLPQVTSEQFTGKVNRMVGAMYGDVVRIAPQITLLVCVIGGILGAFWKEARASVFWSIGALIFILWIPQIIGLFIHYANL
jgi:hypothetical protein